MVQVAYAHRRLLLSWEPSKNEDIIDWVTLFKESVPVDWDDATVLDSREPGLDRAALRDSRDGFTDFVAFLTYEYAQKCRLAGDDHELVSRLPLLEDADAEIHFWAVRQDTGPFKNWRVGETVRAYPWKDPSRWHILPTHDGVVKVGTKEMRADMVANCTTPIMTHVAECGICRGDVHAHPGEPAGPKVDAPSDKPPISPDDTQPDSPGKTRGWFRSMFPWGRNKSPR